ncbi:MAG: sporulation protein YqfD [Bacilli bacterium]|nr:sporulation protein YqfD [Bacilli bacterium]
MNPRRKNAWLLNFESTYTIKVTGKNIDRFLRKLIVQEIELLEVRQINYKELRIRIYKKDYEKIMQIKTIYEVSLLKTHGLLKIKKILAYHKMLLFFMGIGLLILFVLSQMIFTIEIVHTNHEVRDLLKEELKEAGIDKNHFKKSYFKIQKIKKKILEKHKDKIEWLEIVNIGTKYIVRIEMRELPKETKEKELQDVIAKKSAILKRVENKRGVTMKNINDYVEKGSVVISGNVLLNEELKGTIGAEGKIYGEVWYKVKIEYPYIYKEESLTGKQNTVYTVVFLNQRWELFNKKPYKYKKIKSKTLLKNNIIPFYIAKEKQEEKNVIEEFYSEQEAADKAMEEAKRRMQKNLGPKEYIISQKKLKVTPKDSRIVVDMFFTVYEDITATAPVEKIEQKVEEKEAG